MRESSLLSVLDPPVKPEDDIYSLYKQGYFSRASTVAQLMFLKNDPI
jgi:hypothetical protein